MTGKSAINLGSLPAFDAESKDLNVLIETPKGIETSSSTTRGAACSSWAASCLWARFSPLISDSFLLRLAAMATRLMSSS